MDTADIGLGIMLIPVFLGYTNGLRFCIIFKESDFDIIYELK